MDTHIYYGKALYYIVLYNIIILCYSSTQEGLATRWLLRWEIRRGQHASDVTKQRLMKFFLT